MAAAGATKRTKNSASPRRTARRSDPNGTTTNDSQQTLLSAVAPSSKPIELVFGFVGPTGVDLDDACESLIGQLKKVNYETPCRVVKRSN